MKHRALGLLAVLMMSVFAAVGVQAQDELVLGEAVTGALSAEVTAVDYTYAGKAGEVIVVGLNPVDVLGDLNQPALVVATSGGVEVLRYESYGSTTIVTQLPADDVYTITVTRADETSVGEYTLVVINPTELASGETQVGDFESDTNEGTRYYMYSGNTEFDVAFTFEGDYPLGVDIGTLDIDVTPGTLDSVANAGGIAFKGAVLQGIPADDLYIITVGQPLFSFAFNASASYTLTLTAAQ